MAIKTISRVEFAALREAWEAGTPPKCPERDEGIASRYDKHEGLDVWMMTFAPCGHVVRADPDE